MFTHNTPSTFFLYSKVWKYPSIIGLLFKISKMKMKDTISWYKNQSTDPSSNHMIRRKSINQSINRYNKSKINQSIREIKSKSKSIKSINQSIGRKIKVNQSINQSIDITKSKSINQINQSFGRKNSTGSSNCSVCRIYCPRKVRYT